MRRLYRILVLLVVICLTHPFSAKAVEEREKDSNTLKQTSEQRKLDYFFYEGLNLKAQQKYDAAFEMFNHCLEIDSTASAALYEASTFYYQLSRPEKMVDLLKKAVKQRPDNYTYRMTLASITRNMGMFGESAEELEKLITDFPNKTELNFYLADALSQQGETAKAIEAYNKLESAMGMNEPLSLEKYKLYMQIDEKENAYKEIEKLSAKFPMQARYHLLLGDIALENGEPERALAAYQKAFEIEPENPYYVVSMANYYEVIGNKEAAEKEIHNALVNEQLDIDTKTGILSRYILKLQQSQQGTGAANALFQTLLEQHPEDTDLKMMYGSLLVLQEKNEEARFQFQLVTEMEPENPAGWQQRLSLALKAEDLPEVIRICNRCNELFPEAPEYYFYLGIAYYQQEEYEASLETYRKGIESLSQDNPALKSDFWGQIGDIYYQMKQMDQAYAAYEEALKYNERNVMVLNNYAYFLSVDKKELKKAERMSAQTIRIEPNNSTYLDTYAWIFFVQGEYSLAKMYIEKAISNDTTNSTELIDHYGDILFMTGNQEKALEQWIKAKELGKESELLERKIKDKTYYEE
ncbi:tetratricopeptide repeat protein [Parabacteroides sp. OttesenSCG-928-N08]|nr:tetratricopeptide repeat protein [Parabacteroides sp. OttesenSCG-928-N08]